MPKIRMLLVSEEDELAIADEAVAQAAGMTLSQMAELGGALVEVELRSATWERQQEIARQALGSNEEKGFQENAEALNLARVRVMVKKWPLALKPFVDEELHSLLDSADPADVEKAFRGFPASLANASHALILQKMYPSVTSMPDFSKALRDKQRSCEAQPSPTVV